MTFLIFTLIMAIFWVAAVAVVGTLFLSVLERMCDVSWGVNQQRLGRENLV